MVSERRQLVKRPPSQKQTLAELDLSSIPSFREKKFKKNAISKYAVISSKHSGNGDNHAFPKKRTTSVTDHKRVPGPKESLSYSSKPRRSEDVRSGSNPARKQSYHSNKLPNNHHSPRAFSLFTLQEYLHERSHINGVTSPTAYMDSKHLEECGMHMESSHGLHLADKDMDVVPLLQSDVRHNYTRRPRKKVPPGYYAKISGSKCGYNGGGCKHDYRGELHCTGYSTGEEHMDDMNDEKNEALSIKGYHGCVPWHSLSSVPPKCNKKKMIIDLAGKSFACGGFQVSKRHSRLRGLGRTSVTSMIRARKESQWDSISSNFGSESAPLLSDSEEHDAFLQRGCYPGCNSLPFLSRQKLQFADHDNMELSLHSTAPMRCRINQTGHNRGAQKCRAKKDTTNEGNSQYSPSYSSRQNLHGYSKSIHAIENREQVRSLSEKYMPCTFEEIVGQSMISQALSNAVHRGKIAPAYLFQGPRGTGKTCGAKIFAASINCLLKDKTIKTTTPCRTCKPCQSMFLGKSSNVKIVDANNGIGNMKSLFRFITLRPHHSKYKVLIIDECHMLSKEAWSLFLNVIDQPPTHVVFILITTDTDQLPRMVISKCQKFSFVKIKDADILSRLQRLCDVEGIDVEANALQLIASRADGSLFDAETTLDQLTNLGQRITSGLVREMVGLVADETLVELLDGAMRGDSVNTVRCIRQLMDAGIEPLALMSQLATLITDLLAGHPLPLSASSSAFSSHPLGKMELEKLRQALRVLSEAEKQLRSCNNKTTWLTAALLQFCPPDSAFHLDSHNHEAAQSSSMGTSLTQSPNAILDTSEKETADTSCYSVKPPWDTSHQWEDSLRQQAERRQEQPFCHTASIERTENPNNSAVTQINSHSNAHDHNPAVDDVMSSCGAYHRSASAHKKDAMVESESCLQKKSIVIDDTCINYRNGNMNSTQVAPPSMDDIWKQVLEGSILVDILSGQGKLISLSVSEAYAIAHLEFRLLEDKKKAESAKASISEAFQMALGCPVEVQLSLASTSTTVDSDFNPRINNFYGGTNEDTLINQRKGRRRKPRKRPSRARCCNQGSMSANYYSRHRSWCNSSTGHGFLENSALSNARHYIRGSSSDESFTKWIQVYKLGPPQANQKTSASSMRAKSHDQVDHKAKQLAHETYTDCGLSGSHTGKIYVSENVDDTSQDLFYDASLRVERDSPDFSHQSFEYELEYDRSNMTPAFRTGFLCWKSTPRNESKIRHERTRKRQMAGCLPCTS